MLTIKIKYNIDNSDNKLLLNDYIRQYNSVYHVAFNNLQLGKKNKLIDLQRLNNIELLDSWFIQSANFEAKQLYGKVKDKKVIFGGKRNYFQRLKGLISKEQFKLNKLAPLCSYGEKSSGTKHVHGNRKFKISDDLTYITLKLNKQKIQLNLPKHLHNNIKQQLKLIYKHQLFDDIPILYKIDKDYVYISVNEQIIYNNQYKSISNRVMSIDMNPNYIGWSIIDWISESDFNIIKSGVISIKKLNDYEKDLKNQKLSSESKERKYVSNKRNYETLQISKNLINKAIYYRCQIFSIEDLNIKSGDCNKGRKFNRLVNNQWCRNKLVNNLTKRCNIFGIKFIQVKPEYSSFIGNFLFRTLNLPDPVLASIEISRRAYEFYNQYIVKVKEIKKNIIQPKIDQFRNFWVKSLEEFNLEDNWLDFKQLYLYFKKSKMMYRLSVDKFNLQFSSIFSHKSQLSQVYI